MISYSVSVREYPWEEKGGGEADQVSRYLIAGSQNDPSWSLSPVRVALLRQQPGRVTKKQRRDAKAEERGTLVRTCTGALYCVFSG